MFLAGATRRDSSRTSWLGEKPGMPSRFLSGHHPAVSIRACAVCASAARAAIVVLSRPGGRASGFLLLARVGGRPRSLGTPGIRPVSSPIRCKLGGGPALPRSVSMRAPAIGPCTRAPPLRGPLATVACPPKMERKRQSQVYSQGLVVPAAGPDAIDGSTRWRA